MLESLTAPAVVGTEEAFATVSGRRMRYLKAGTGPALLLVHGIMSYSFCWRFNLLPLSEIATVYAPDLLNCGYSEHASDVPADLKSNVARLIEFLDHVGVDSAHVLGSSHGGAIAMAMATLFPKRIKSLILCSPANPWSRASDRLLRFYSTRPGRFFAGIIPYCPLYLQRQRYGGMYGDRLRLARGTVEGYRGAWRIPGTVAYTMKIVAGWREDMQFLEQSIPHLRLPVTIVWGDCDPVVSPSSGRNLAEALPHARLEIIAGAGHQPYEELPAEFNTVVKKHLENL